MGFEFLQPVLFRLVLPCMSLYVGYRVFKNELIRSHRWAFAFFMSKMAVSYNKLLGKRKQKLFAHMHDSGTRLNRPLRVLEVGAGSGANFRYYPDGTTVVCLDPNPNFDSYLQRASIEHPHVDIKNFVLGKAESMPEVASDSFDCVVCTLVLCSVDNIDQSLSEIKRVLNKGGAFYFMEHTKAQPNTWIFTIQRWIEPIWTIIGDGCKFKEPWKYIERAGFEKVNIERFEVPALKGIRKALPVVDLLKPHMMGTAIK